MASFMLYGLGDAHERPDMFPIEGADISKDTLEGDKRPRTYLPCPIKHEHSMATCGTPEPPADITRLRTTDSGTATVPPAPVPVGLRVAVKASLYVLALLVVLTAIGVMVGVTVRTWSWALGLL